MGIILDAMNGVAPSDAQSSAGGDGLPIPMALSDQAAQVNDLNDQMANQKQLAIAQAMNTPISDPAGDSGLDGAVTATDPAAQFRRMEIQDVNDRARAAQQDARAMAQQSHINLSPYQQAYLDQRIQHGVWQGGDPLDGDALAQVLKASQLPELGSVSKEFESGHGGPGTIGYSREDKGGASYGAYQLASQGGALQDFLKNEGARWADRLSANDRANPNGEFSRAWKQIAAEEPEAFEKAQHDFNMNSLYQPVLKNASQIGFDVNDPGVQNALFSQATQHSFKGNLKILQNAKRVGNLTSMTPTQQIAALYKARGDYFDANNVTPVNAGHPRYNLEQPKAIELSQNFGYD